MKEILELIENYGATTILSGVAIYLFQYLNKERAELLKQLDTRTQDYLNSIYNISTRIDVVKEDVEEIKDIIKKKN